MSITADHARRVFVLEIAGLNIRYYSGPSPVGSNLSTHIDTGGLISYQYEPSITSLGHYSARLDPAGGVGDYDPLTITLGINKTGGVNDPHVIFDRAGLRSTVVSSKISTDLTHTDTAPIIVSTQSDLSSLSYPRLMHLGAETFTATSATSNTITLAERGVGGSPIQAHVITLDGVSTPEITTGLTTFRGRRASLWCAVERPDQNTVSDYIELINGFIESTPTNDGLDIQITLTPLSALLDTQLSVRGKQSGLLHGFHYFTAGAGAHVEWGTYSAIDYSFLAEYFSPTVFNVFEPIHQMLDDDLLDSLGNPIYTHPRYASFSVSQSSYVSADTFTLDAGGQDVTSYTWSNASAPYAYNHYQTIHRGRTEVKGFSLPAGVQVWPKVFRDTSYANMPTTHEGLSGGFSGWYIAPAGDGERLTIKTLVHQKLGAGCVFWTDWASFVRSFRMWAPPSASPSKYDSGGRFTSSMDAPTRFHYGYDFTSIDSDEYPTEPVRVGEHHRGGGRGGTASYENTGPQKSSQSFEIRGPSLAYYQLFEPVILIESALNLPSSAGSEIYTVEVRYYDRAEGEERTQFYRVTHQSTVIYDSVIVGYNLHLDMNGLNQNNVSFGDWATFDRCVISLADRYEGVTAGEAILRLLESGGGGSVNGAYDLGGVGLNIHSDNIDENSFLAFNTMGGIDTFDSSLSSADLNPREIIDPILKSMGAVLTMRRDVLTGRSRLSLVPIGLEQTTRTLGQLTDASSWLSDPPLSSSIYEDIVTQVKIEYDYDPLTQEWGSPKIFNNQEAITRYGDEQKSINLKLYGVRGEDFGRSYADILSFFKTVYSRLFRLLSNPLRLWRGAIGTGQSIYTDLGSYWGVTSDHYKGYGDEYGITNSVAMIRAIDQDLMGEGCTLELLHLNEQVVGYNASARVSAVISPTVLEMYANTYALYDRDGGAVHDVAFFSAGDVVDYLPLADEDNITTLTISSINNDQVTFSSAHGVSVINGDIQPTTFLNAAPAHQNESFMGDQNNDILGSGTPQEYM